MSHIRLKNYGGGGKRYLYRRGNQCIDITGGWSNNGYTIYGHSYSFTTNIVTYNSDHIYMTCGNTTYGNFPGTGTINPINLTQYRKLCIEYTYTDTKGYSHVNRWTVCNQKYSLSEATPSGGVEGQAWMFPLGTNITHKVDISSYKGLWYINGIIHHQNPTTKVYVYNIWLER